MTKTKLASKVSYLALAVAAANITCVYADESPSQAITDSAATKTSSTIQVIGTEEDGFNVSMTDDMIEKRQVTDLEDMFRHEPSITVGGGLPVAQKIYVRGIEDTLLNVTIDGATQAGYLYHHQGRVNVEPELVKNVIIKSGAGNATDGAGALGGAIHFKLKDAKDMLREGERFGALAKTSYFSNNEGWKNHLSAYGMLNDDFGLLASITRYDTGDNYSDGHGDEVDNTEFEQESIRFKLSGTLLEDHYLALSYEEYDDDGTRFARPNMVDIGLHPAYPSTLVPQETHRESAIFNYGYNPDSPWIDLKSTVYYNDSYLTKKGDVYAANWPPAGPPPTWTFADYYDGKAHGAGIESLGFDLRNTSRIGKHEITYGAEYREDEAYLVKGYLDDFNNEETEIAALYVQTDIQLAPSLRLSTGIRYDDYDYTDNQGENFSDDAISPNATLSLDISNEMEIFASYAQAFKGVSSPEAWFLEFPYLNQALQSYRGPDIGGAVPLTELQAEKSDNLEFGFKYEGVNFAASGEIFSQTIENAQIISGSQGVRYSFGDDVTVKGYAFRVAYFWDDLTLNAGVSLSKPKLGGEPLSSGDMGLGTAYGRTWTTGLEYQMQHNLTLGWNARLVQRLKDVPEGQDEKAGYGIHDVYVQWLPTEDLTLGLAVNNMFDKFYYDQGSFFSMSEGADPIGLPEPGRDIRVSAAYQF
ncbi:TonB-dependent receptor domain-containing protein [Litoribrevibacter euphylliae]|uniref:TonB-dependent receptor domain-containing protein n=1 Tax=Litoribrevibacter euphylliae TaxID=1834034 RepID=A0ABV7H9L0_9GAMM